jgi:hypothetical protein
LPVTTGYTTYFTNIGGIRNRGIEAAVDLKPVVSERFHSGAIRTIFTKNKNIVTKLTEGITRFSLGSGTYELG